MDEALVRRIAEEVIETLTSIIVKVVEEYLRQTNGGCTVVQTEPAPAAPMSAEEEYHSRLITEKQAVALMKESYGKVWIRRDAIVTPAAWDIFIRNKIEVIRK